AVISAEFPMVDEFKSIRDNLLKALSGLAGSSDELDEDYEESVERSASPIDASAAKAIIATVFARAGKGKDEIVQIIAREIGGAVAALLKEPLSQLAKNQKLQISFEFVPKSGAPNTKKKPRKAQKRAPGTAAARRRAKVKHARRPS